MKPVSLRLTNRLALIVIAIETVLLVGSGSYLSRSLSDEVDERVKARQRLYGRLLASGQQPVYYIRTFRKSGRYGIRRPAALEYATQQLGWIAELLGAKPKQLPFQLKVDKDMVWRDERTYLRKVATERAKVLGAYQSMVTRLAIKGLCNKDQLVDLKPEIRILVGDYRSARHDSLPHIDGVRVSRYPAEDFEIEEEIIEEEEVTEEDVKEKKRGR